MHEVCRLRLVLSAIVYRIINETNDILIQEWAHYTIREGIHRVLHILGTEIGPILILIRVCYCDLIRWVHTLSIQ